MARPESTPAVPAITAVRPAFLTADRMRRRGIIRSSQSNESAASSAPFDTDQARSQCRCCAWISIDRWITFGTGGLGGGAARVAPVLQPVVTCATTGEEHDGARP